MEYLAHSQLQRMLVYLYVAYINSIIKQLREKYRPLFASSARRGKKQY
jgi:hypothetical protein